MDSDGDPLATFTRGDGHVEASLTRTYAHSVDDVWTALTTPSILPLWLAPGDIDLHPGGAVRLDFADSGIVIDSTVTALEPGRLLEYSWSSPGEPARPLRWTLEPMLGGCRLTLRMRVPADEDAARACAGWEAHMEMLGAALEGVPIRFPFDLFKAARDVYRDRIPG